MQLAAVGLASAGLVAGCSTGATTASPTPTTEVTQGPIALTKKAAGQRYLAFACASNKAGERFGEAVDDIRDFGDPMTPAAKKAALNLAKVEARSARGLTSPKYVWPANVQRQIDRMAIAAFEDSATFRRVAKWVTFDYAPEQADIGEAPSVVRLRLGLPPRGEGCDT